MKNNFYIEVGVALALAVLALLVLNPLALFMPDMTTMFLLALLLAAFCALAVFVVRERAGDEREEAHRALAGRYAFLAGAFVLVVGITLGALNHATDPWLVGALLAMVITKLVTRLWADRCR